jgi:hypothetical protein
LLCLAILAFTDTEKLQASTLIDGKRPVSLLTRQPHSGSFRLIQARRTSTNPLKISLLPRRNLRDPKAGSNIQQKKTLALLDGGKRPPLPKKPNNFEKKISSAFQ